MSEEAGGDGRGGGPGSARGSGGSGAGSGSAGELADPLGAALAGVELHGGGTLASVYPVSWLASASIAAAAVAAADVVEAIGAARPRVRIDRPLADAWFRQAVTPIGWQLPSPWDALAGDYATRDGWIRLHTNAPHHRAAALAVLGLGQEEADRRSVAAAVRDRAADELESAIVDARGAAAALRSPDEWSRHPQGEAVAGEPLIARRIAEAAPASSHWRPTPGRPLAGLRVLDLTRVLAGPVSTRLLAGLGAQVLRVDPPDWHEPALEPEMTLGKRTARLDARTGAGRRRLEELLAGCDVLVHGYRRDALDRLGFGEARRRELRPGLVDVSLDAYGHGGPWADRRGFDSLVQVSTGIADRGREHAAATRRSGEPAVPVPLPVQALDHATGYLAAAAVLEGLALRARTGTGSTARLSLARTALELERLRRTRGVEVVEGAPGASAVGASPAGLASAGQAWAGQASAGRESAGPESAGRESAGLAAHPIATHWGPARMLAWPLALTGVVLETRHPSAPLGTHPAEWVES